MNAIETKQLTKFYGCHRAIEAVDLEVAEGDFFGFIGPNGAGKSTTIRTLLGFLRPTSGEARIFGKAVGDNQPDILSDIGYLPSESGYYDKMKVSELLKLSAELRRKDCRQEGKLLCERLDLDPTRKIRELSLGNRKKLGIICALQHKPRLYILDEPTSGLDPLIQKEFYSILQERNRDGATVFLSSHVLSEIGRYCKTAAVISKGSILTCDRVEKLGHRDVKRVILRGVEKLPQIPHGRDLHLEGETLRFLYSGDGKSLLSHLSQINFEDLTITDPDLEEIFLHYYAKEAEA